MWTRIHVLTFGAKEAKPCNNGPFAEGRDFLLMNG